MMGEIARMNAEIDAVEVQLAEEGRFDGADERMKGLHDSCMAQQAEKAKGRAVDSIRRTNEYAAAFAKALRNGVKLRQAWGMEEFAPLTKALTESGGTPEGSDGGFLVPEDFDNLIHEYEKEYLDLCRFFTVEPVRTLSGDLIPSADSGVPVYVGKFQALGTLFIRKGLEMAATDIGGDAWATDSYELRGLCRMDAVAMDNSAAFKAVLGGTAG